MLNNQSHKHWYCSVRGKTLNCKRLETSNRTHIHMCEFAAWKNPHRNGNLNKSQGSNDVLFEGHYMSSVDCHLRRGTDGRAGKNGRMMHLVFMQSWVAQGFIWRYHGHILTFTQWRIINRAKLEGRLNSGKGVSLHMWHSHQFHIPHDWAVGSHHSQSSNIHHQTHTFKHI